MRRSLGPFIIGFAAGVLCLAIFLALTGKLSLNRQEPPQSSTLSSPLSAPDLPQVPAHPTNVASPEPPDAATFAHPPDLTPSDLTRPPRSASTTVSPPLPDPSTFKPAASPASGTGQSDIQALSSKHLVMPIAGLKPSNILDTFNEARGSGRKHEATDILSPRGTPVLAMDEGNVVKLFTSKRGGLTVYQFDNQGVYCYYYAHLDRYAEGLKEGMLLRKGDKLGYVGSTGDADAKTPHLHLAINKLGPDKHWWQGTPLNPYPVLMHILGK